MGIYGQVHGKVLLGLMVISSPFLPAASKQGYQTPEYEACTIISLAMSCLWLETEGA
jgi:hypothetical protein